MSRVRVLATAALVTGLAAAFYVMRRPPLPPEVGLSPSAQRELPAAPGPRNDRADFSASKRDSRKAPELQRSAAGTLLLGNVIAPLQATLSVKMPSRIRSVFAHEGQPVRAGQTLIELDQAELATQVHTSRAGETAAAVNVTRARAGLEAQRVKAASDVDAARAAVRQAETHLQQAQLARQSADEEQKADLRVANEGVKKAKIALDRARETLRGLEDLAGVGGVSRTELEGARSQERAAASDLETANAQVDRLKAGSGGVSFRVAAAQRDVESAQSGLKSANDGLTRAQEGGRQTLRVGQQDVRAAQAALDQAAAGLAGARVLRSQERLATPIAGIVTSVPARVGETAQPGSPLVTIVSMTGLRVDALVPARLLSQFHAGQSASVAIDTAPGRLFQAAVSQIARIAEPDGRTFRVNFRLFGAPPVMPGQTAHIRVDTRK